MNRSYLKFKDKYLDLFNRLFEPSMFETFGADIFYARRTKLFQQHLVKPDEQIDLTFKEYVFSCFTIIDKDETNFALHMVSGEYNLSDTSNPYIAGRFIVSSSFDMKEIYILTVAEEPAKSVSVPGGAAESSYLQMRTSNMPGEFPKMFTGSFADSSDYNYDTGVARSNAHIIYVRSRRPLE